MFFTAYFDASRGDGITTVAGWLGTTVAWESFDIDWKILLAQYDIPYFHMREFAPSVGPFKKWKGQEGLRANFLRKAVHIIGHSVHYGLGCMIEDAIFAKMNETYALTEVFGNPFCLAARDCLAHANLWLRKDQRGLEVDYVFEDGDEGKGCLINVLKLNDPPIVPQFAPSRGPSARLPLQGADFAAWELLKATKIGEYTPLYKHRASMKALAQIDGMWGKYGEQDLTRLCQELKIPLR